MMKKLLLAAVLGLTPLAQAEKPNIIYIIADDLGFGDVQCNNPHSKIPTPHINKLASEGVRFTDLHTNSAVCTPTRYGVVTGRYSWRTTLQQGAIMGTAKGMIPPERMTVASLLRDNGYYTACIGKWHIGWDWVKGTEPDGRKGIDYTKEYSKGPVDCGFDYFFGICASLDMPPYTYCRGRKVINQPTRKAASKVFGRPGWADPNLKAEDVMIDITKEITSLIDNHKDRTGDKPFFVYFPLPAPHHPVRPAEQFKGKTEYGDYGDYVYEIDWVVGQVMESLEKAGIAENTLVMFTSDNGASASAASSAVRKGHKPNWPFRGGKTTIYEGGHRVPFIASWPAKAKKGIENKDVFCTTDLMATCADIVGAKLPDNAGEDSISMLPALEGKPTPPSRKAVIHHSVMGNFAIRMGKWKYIVTSGRGSPRGGNWGMKRLPIDDEAGGQLYDMSKDTYEATNLYKHHPEIAATLKKQLQEIIDNGRSTPGENQKNDAPIKLK